MIPLNTDLKVKRVHPASTIFCIAWILIFIVGLFYSDAAKSNFISFFTVLPDKLLSIDFFKSIFIFPTFLSFLIHLLFFWVYSHHVFEKKGFILTMLIACSCALLSAKLYTIIHPLNKIPLFLSEPFVAAILAIYMRDSIWAHTNTLVIGFFGIKVFKVPSYVLLFFYFFYIMLSTYALPYPYSEAPIPYGIHFFSFIFGFLAALPRLKTT